MLERPGIRFLSIQLTITIELHPLIVRMQGKQHNHAFQASPSSTRLARVLLVRGQLPQVSVGIRFEPSVPSPLYRQYCKWPEFTLVLNQVNSIHLYI
jgi:hypothetical protein